MKLYLKIFMLLIFCYLNNVELFSQYKFGIQGGMGISNYTGKDFPQDNEAKSGITVGLYFEREINLTLSLGFDVNYDKKGTNYNDYPHEGTTVSVSNRSSYLNLPVYAKAYFGKRANYYLYLGVAASYLWDNAYSVNTTEYGYEVSSKPYFSYIYNQWDAGVIGGVGFNFYEIILDIRYNYGIVNVYEGHNVPVMRNSFISATIGYTIYKKKVISCFKGRAY